MVKKGASYQIEEKRRFVGNFIREKPVLKYLKKFFMKGGEENG